MANPTYGGVSIFGLAVSIQMVPAPIEVQRTVFSGVHGVFQATGGSRGRRFLVEGVLGGVNLAACVTARDLLLSYADGIARTLLDTTGASWPFVVFNGEFGPDPAGYSTNSAGVFLKYRATFEGLV